jgi:phosphoribosylformylglycinamidine synthase
MSAKGQVGMDVDLDLVPLREEGMSAYEIMLSESQERMLVVLQKGKESTAKAIFDKWDLHCVQIGHITDDGMLRLHRHGKLCAEIPADSLVLGGGAPRYKRDTKKPAYLDDVASYSPEKDPIVKDITVPSDLAAFFADFMGSINLASRRPLYEQYDTEVGLVKVIGPGGDGGLTRIPGTNKGIATATDCNSRYVYLNPKRGSSQAVCESARNVAVTGSRPIGVTNNLNFANPYIPENYYIFTECIAGMSEACRHLGLPVTGGNVSFYNESADGPIYPTPTIGMVGLINDLSKAVLPFFKKEDHLIYLAGHFQPVLGGSEYLKTRFSISKGATPELNLDHEKNLIEFLLSAADQNLPESAQDLSIGGLARTLFRSAYNSGTRSVCGFQLDQSIVSDLIKKCGRTDSVFFGETNGCAVVSVSKEKASALEETALKYNVTLRLLGHTINNQDLDYGTFKVPGEILVNSYESGLTQIFGS